MLLDPARGFVKGALLRFLLDAGRAGKCEESRFEEEEEREGNGDDDAEDDRAGKEEGEASNFLPLPLGVAQPALPNAVPLLLREAEEEDFVMFEEPLLRLLPTTKGPLTLAYDLEAVPELEYELSAP